MTPRPRRKQQEPPCVPNNNSIHPQRRTRKRIKAMESYIFLGLHRFCALPFSPQSRWWSLIPLRCLFDLRCSCHFLHRRRTVAWTSIVFIVCLLPPIMAFQRYTVSIIDPRSTYSLSLPLRRKKKNYTYKLRIIHIKHPQPAWYYLR